MLSITLFPLYVAMVLSITTDDLYIPTPVGLMLKHCVHEIPEGALSRSMSDGTTHIFLSVNDEHPLDIIQQCDTMVNGKSVPMIKLRSQAGNLPPDYDGWLQYTAVNVSTLGLEGGFDSFTNVMSVPKVPKERPQILYLFPGLQNSDWIPKVDPEPTKSNPFDIIQPVLQYPGGLFSSGWELKSWYVTVNAGALYSRGISGIKAGDAILCNMTRTGDTAWTVIGALKSDPSKKTVQNADSARLKLQPWAYNTVECYGCNGCGTYPENPVVFTDNTLYQGGKLVPVKGSQWAINPKPAKKLMCNEKTTVDPDSGDTTVSFQ